MRQWILVFVTLAFYSTQVFGQQKIADSLTQTHSKHSINGQNGETKVQLQQQLLLGRQQQLEIVRQQQQKRILEQQKKELADKEKLLLELRVQKKQSELEHDRKTQAQVLLSNQLEALYNATVKDKQINNQQAEIGYNKKWNLFLIILFLIVAVFAALTYYSQRKTKQLNALISAQHDALEQMGMVKDTILGVVSHDMRTPVNTLISFTELIKEGDISAEKLSGYLDQINLTLNHTSALMNNLLNWAASQMQGFKPVIEKVDAAAVASNIIQSFSDRAEVKKIKLTHQIEAGTIVMADANMLDLVLRNLVSNALKYTWANGHIIMKAVTTPESVILSVSDTGIGMKDENITRFNSITMHPAQSTTGTAREKGTGLGLLLCKTFTRLMNGKIIVQKNKDGPGCSFELLLPGTQV